MRALLFTIVASTALASGAQAYTISSSATLPSNPTSPHPTTSTPVVLTDLTSSKLSGTNTYRSPFEGTKYPNSPFTSVEGSGSAIFDFTSPHKLTELTLIWGSPDKYNELQIFSGLDGSGSKLADIFGNNSAIIPFAGAAPHNPTTPGLGYSFVKISGLSGFESVKFVNNPKDNAFEFSTLSAVPLPASAPLFGMALLAMAGYGYAKRGKRAGAAAAA